jgi:hypothetical protein
VSVGGDFRCVDGTINAGSVLCGGLLEAKGIRSHPDLAGEMGTVHAEKGIKVGTGGLCAYHDITCRGPIESKASVESQQGDILAESIRAAQSVSTPGSIGVGEQISAGEHIKAGSLEAWQGVVAGRAVDIKEQIISPIVRAGTALTDRHGRALSAEDRQVRCSHLNGRTDNELVLHGEAPPSIRTGLTVEHADRKTDVNRSQVNLEFARLASQTMAVAAK